MFAPRSCARVPGCSHFLRRLARFSFRVLQALLIGAASFGPPRPRPSQLRHRRRSRARSVRPRGSARERRSIALATDAPRLVSMRLSDIPAACASPVAPRQSRLDREHRQSRLASRASPVALRPRTSTDLGTRGRPGYKSGAVRALSHDRTFASINQRNSKSTLWDLARLFHGTEHLDRVALWLIANRPGADDGVLVRQSITNGCKGPRPRSERFRPAVPRGG